MNNSKTPKIVVGVGLAAIYATAMAAFIPRGAHDNVVAQTASAAPSAQVAAEPAPPPTIAPASADAATSVAAQPAVTSSAATPVASTAAKTLEAPPARRESEAKSQSTEQKVASLATASPKREGGFEESGAASQANSAGDNIVITAEAKPSMAAAAPEATVDVTTTGGVVEPTASVSSSQE